MPANTQYQSLLKPILAFLHCETPDAWITEAQKPENLKVILTDHLLCELKAAQSAMYLIRKYAVDETSTSTLLDWFKPYEDFAYRHIGTLKTLSKNNQLSKSIIARAGSPYSQDLIDKMVLLLKEELHHFYQVFEIMQKKGITYNNISAGRYARGLLSQVRTYEPDTLIDKLIVGAYIEARSCERFAKLAPYMDDDISRFYISLLRSEARHYQDYIKLAQSISHKNISNRIYQLGQIEAELISSPDHDFKFHSGIPGSVS